MTREDRAYNWLDRQVDKFRSDENKAKVMSRHTTDMHDRALVLNSGADEETLKANSKKLMRNWKRYRELSKSLDGKRVRTRDPLVGIRFNRVKVQAQNFDKLLTAQKKRNEKAAR